MPFLLGDTYVWCLREKYHRFKRCRLVSVCSCWWLFRLRKPHTENGTETSCLHHLPPWRAAGQLLLCWRRKESGPLLVIHGGIWGIIFNQWPCKWVTVFFLNPGKMYKRSYGPPLFHRFLGPFWTHFEPNWKYWKFGLPGMREIAEHVKSQLGFDYVMLGFAGTFEPVRSDSYCWVFFSGVLVFEVIIVWLSGKFRHC